MTLSLDEFLRRFLLHVLPKGFVRIRNFGVLANRRRVTLLPLCLQTLGTFPPALGGTRNLPSSASQSALALPNCGGSMVVVERLTAAQLQLRSPPFFTGAAA